MATGEKDFLKSISRN